MEQTGSESGADPEFDQSTWHDGVSHFAVDALSSAVIDTEARVVRLPLERSSLVTYLLL